MHHHSVSIDIIPYLYTQISECLSTSEISSVGMQITSTPTIPIVSSIIASTPSNAVFPWVLLNEFFHFIPSDSVLIVGDLWNSWVSNYLKHLLTWPYWIWRHLHVPTLGISYQPFWILINISWLQEYQL